MKKQRYIDSLYNISDYTDSSDSNDSDISNDNKDDSDDDIKDIKNKINNIDISQFRDKIKYIHPPEVEHKNKVISSSVLQCCIFGSSRSGKTTKLIELIPMIHDFVFCMICSNVFTPAHKSILEYCESNEIPNVHCTNPNKYDELLKMCINFKKNTEHGLIIFDDYTRYSNSRMDKQNNQSIMAISQLGNKLINVVYISQQPTHIPTVLRNNASLRLIFKLAQKHAVDSTYNDLISVLGNNFSRDIFNKIWEKLVQIKYAFLTLYNSNIPILCWCWKTPLFVNNKLQCDISSIKKID